jgi:hypothetical protein
LAEFNNSFDVFIPFEMSLDANLNCLLFVKGLGNLNKAMIFAIYIS